MAEPSNESRALAAQSDIALSTPSSPCTIRDIPPDLLYVIMLFCHRETATRGTFPITASHVCQAWRTCALNAAILWTKLTFNKPKICVEEVEARIERSGEALLEIEFFPEPFQRSSMKTLRIILRLIVPQAYRWRRLIVSLTPDKVTRCLFDQLAHVATPRLEGLCLDTYMQPSKWILRPFRGDTPQMRTLIVQNVSFDWSSPLLTHVKTIRVWLHTTLVSPPIGHIIRGAPELEDLFVYIGNHISFEGGRGVSQSSTSRTQVPAINFSHSSPRKLSVSPATLDSILRIAELPNLVHLSLNSHLFYLPRHGVTRLRHSSPKLSHLTIGTVVPEHLDRVLNMELLVTLFKDVESLRSMTFDTFTFNSSNPFVQKLAYISPPNVDDITFNECEGLRSTALREMVLGRMDVKNAKRFRRLKLDGYTSLRMDDDPGGGFREWLRGSVEVVEIDELDDHIKARFHRRPPQ